MKFSEYRSLALKVLWTKYVQDQVVFLPEFKTCRIDDICASFWRSRSDVFNEQCTLELEEYLVGELHAKREVVTEL